MNEQAIQHYREMLLTLRDEVRTEIQSSIEALPEKVRPVGEHDLEPSEGLDRELALEHNEHAIYQAINVALKRIDDGEFGRCVACGANISSARLNAIPYTPYCSKCEREVEAEQ